MLVTTGNVEGNASSLGYSVFTPGTVLAPVKHEAEEVAYVVSGSGELQTRRGGGAVWRGRRTAHSGRRLACRGQHRGRRRRHGLRLPASRVPAHGAAGVIAAAQSASRTGRLRLPDHRPRGLRRPDARPCQRTRPGRGRLDQTQGRRARRGRARRHRPARRHGRDAPPRDRPPHGRLSRPPGCGRGHPRAPAVRDRARRDTGRSRDPDARRHPVRQRSRPLLGSRPDRRGRAGRRGRRGARRAGGRC